MKSIATVGTDVAPGMDVGMLASFDGEVGDLFDMLLSPPTLLAKRVPLQDVVTRGFELAFVAEVDEANVGNLLVKAIAAKGEKPDDSPPRRIARGVMAGSVQGMSQPTGYAYLAEPRKEGATLRAYLDDDQVELRVANGVSEFLSEVFPGVVYAIPEGTDAGIWWARPR